jgi:HEPN domain-containing protein
MTEIKNRLDFQKLAELRLKEAKVLLKNKCYEGAYYLAGYSVECALKACIAKKTQLHDFPPKPQVVSSYYTHHIESLANFAGLQVALKNQEQSVVHFRTNWGYVTKWAEHYRYETQVNSQDAWDLYRAITNSRSGVLVWLKKYW